MRQQINLVCDKCGGAVWKDVEFHKHIEFSCLCCGKLWFINKTLLQKVIDRKIAERYNKTHGVVIT